MEEIERCIQLIGKTTDIIDGYLEGDIISFMELLVTYDKKIEFEQICESIYKSELKSFREINNYLLLKIKSPFDPYSKDPKWSEFYIDILEKYK